MRRRPAKNIGKRSEKVLEYIKNRRWNKQHPRRMFMCHEIYQKSRVNDSHGPPKKLHWQFTKFDQNRNLTSIFELIPEYQLTLCVSISLLGITYTSSFPKKKKQSLPNNKKKESRSRWKSRKIANEKNTYLRSTPKVYASSLAAKWGNKQKAERKEMKENYF